MSSTSTAAERNEDGVRIANWLKLSRDDYSLVSRGVTIKPSAVMRDLGVLLDAEPVTGDEIRRLLGESPSEAVRSRSSLDVARLAVDVSPIVSHLCNMSLQSVVLSTCDTEARHRLSSSEETDI